MKFAHRIMSLPVLAALAFVVILVLSFYGALYGGLR